MRVERGRQTVAFSRTFQSSSADAEDTSPSPQPPLPQREREPEEIHAPAIIAQCFAVGSASVRDPGVLIRTSNSDSSRGFVFISNGIRRKDRSQRS